MDPITKNGDYDIPVTRKIGRREVVTGRAKFTVAVPPEIREIRVEIPVEKRVEIPIPPSTEACRQLFPRLDPYGVMPPEGMPKKDITHIQMMMMLTDLGLSVPDGNNFLWYTAKVFYKCPPAEAYFKFYKPYLSMPLIGNRSGDVVCVDETFRVMSRSREWLPNMAIFCCTGSPDYLPGDTDGWNMAFLLNEKGEIEVWYVDSTREVIRNFTKDGLRYITGLGSVVL